MVQHELTIDVARPPSHVYAFLADVAKMSIWLTRCVEVKRLSDATPTLAAGDRLVYTYRERSRTATLQGVVEAAEVDRHLDLRFTDRMMNIRVAFDLSPEGGGTRLRQITAIEPKTLLLKLIKPLIRRGVAKDTAEDIAKLKRALESQA